MDNAGRSRVVRASALEAVDLGLIQSQVKPMTLTLSLRNFSPLLYGINLAKNHKKINFKIFMSYWHGLSFYQYNITKNGQASK